MNPRSFGVMEEAGGGAAGGGAGGQGGAEGGGQGKGSLLAGAAGGDGAAGGQGGQGSGGNGNANGGQGGGGEAKPFYADLYGPDGKLNKASFDRLPDSLKSHKDLFTKYETVEALLGGMRNLAKLATGKGLEPLPANASAEEKAERQKHLNTLLGVPEKPEGYGIKKPDNVPADQWNEPYVKSMVEVMHKHGASPELVRALVEADMQQAGKLRADGERQAIERENQEKAKLREALQVMPGGIDKNLNLAAKMARTLGLDPNDASLFGDHRLVAALAKAGAMVSEDKLIQGEGAGGDGMTYQQKAIDIVTNKANPLYAAFHDANHPQHEHAVKVRSNFNRLWLEQQAKTG